MWIGNRGNQSGRDQGTNAGNIVKAPADLARTVPGKNAAVRIENLMLHHLKLSAQGQETATRARRYAVIIAILDDLQQPLQPIAANPGTIPNSARWARRALISVVR